MRAVCHRGRSTAQLTIDLIAAARPNFTKIAPLYHVLKAKSWCAPRIVHTGHHYDANMSDALFRRPRHAEAARASRRRQRRSRRANWARHDRVRKGVYGVASGLDRRRWRRELDAGLRARRREAADSRRPSRSRVAERRSPHARGNQPPGDGCDRGRSTVNARSERGVPCIHGARCHLRITCAIASRL